MQDADFLHSGLSLYYLGSIHTWCQGTVPEYGNYLALKIFKYSCWNLGAMPVKDLVLKHKSGHWVPLWRSILLLLGQSTALHSLLKAHVPQWGLTGQNGVTMYTESHSGRILKVWTQHLFVLRYPLVFTGSWARNVDSPLLT